MPKPTAFWSKPLRTVIEEPNFSEQLSKLAVAHKRLDESMAGITFALARAPEEFGKVPGTQLFIAKTVVYEDAPALRIFFTYTDTEVHLLGVEFAEDDCELF